MISTGNVYCRTIVNILVSGGISTAFCSPGSRNAPLLIALDACDDIEKRVVVDERSAAFQALGYAIVKRRPVLLVCTSGTALLNYAPAVAEAYYSGVPLIVISADRPREWIDQDDSQTIRQFYALSNIVKGSYDIRAIAEGRNREFTPDVRWTTNRTVNEALLKAIEGKPGPVHINVQLADPLGDVCECSDNKERIVTVSRGCESLTQNVLKSFADIARNSKILVVAGFCPPSNDLDRAVRMLASLPNVAVMAESISNLHDVQKHSSMVDSVLCRMSEIDREQFRPDIVISFGGALVSRMLKQYLRSYPPKYHWALGHSNYFCDCFQSLTDIIDVDPASFIRQLYGVLKKNKDRISSSYSHDWIAIKDQAFRKSEDYIASAPWSDLKAFDCIFRYLNLDNLFISNGTAIRYSQLIPHQSHAEYCNRGVSGIDGSTATAVGGAIAYKGNTTLITGDMSWIYDSGASTLNAIPCNMRVVVINNAGGGIFRFIKSTSNLTDSTLEKYFCVNNLPDISAIASAYGIDTLEANDLNQLKDSLAWLEEESDLPKLLVVNTPPSLSADVLKQYFKS